MEIGNFCFSNEFDPPKHTEVDRHLVASILACVTRRRSYNLAILAMRV